MQIQLLDRTCLELWKQFFDRFESAARPQKFLFPFQHLSTFQFSFRNMSMSSLCCFFEGLTQIAVRDLGGVAQVIFHGVQVVEVGVQVRVHQDRGVEEDGEGQV